MSGNQPTAVDTAHFYRFEEGTDQTWSPLVLLHGSDGTEADLLPLAKDLAPGASRLSIRGTVATESGYAFFRRFPDPRIDEADLAARVPVLADFVTASRDRFHPTRSPVAIGFSNGAIMSTALLMADPGLLAGAVLFRSLLPFTLPPSTSLYDIPVLVIDGRDDMRRSAGDGRDVADQLQALGAVVSHHVLPAGHTLTGCDRQIAKEWLAAQRLR